MSDPIVIGREYPDEGYVIMDAGDIKFKIGYTALYHVWQNYICDPDSRNWSDLVDFNNALRTLCAEVAMGKSPDNHFGTKPRVMQPYHEHKR